MHFDSKLSELVLTRIQPLLSIAAMVIAVAAACITTAFLLVFRRQMARLGKQVSSRANEIAKLNAELEAQALLARQMSVDLDELRRRLLDREEVAQSASWSAAGTPVNLNRRGQILRLSRKGKSVAEIASDLNIAQGEVDLLLKVHDLSQKQADAQK